MTAATAILRQEHDAILRMLEVAEETARRLALGEGVAAEVLAGLVEFFQVFADRCHHGKEEGLLFPLLQKKGVPRADGPLGVMLYEHELGRSLVEEMRAAAESYSAGAAEASRKWAEAARAYATLLRHHIDKENNVLFRAADRLLAEAEQEELERAFQKLEEEKIGVSTHERLHALAESLALAVGFRHNHGLAEAPASDVTWEGHIYTVG